METSKIYYVPIESDKGLVFEDDPIKGDVTVDKNKLYLNIEYDGIYFYFPEKYVYDRSGDKDFTLRTTIPDYIDFIINKN